MWKDVKEKTKPKIRVLGFTETVLSTALQFTQQACGDYADNTHRLRMLLTLSRMREWETMGDLVLRTRLPREVLNTQIRYFLENGLLEKNSAKSKSRHSGYRLSEKGLLQAKKASEAASHVLAACFPEATEKCLWCEVLIAKGGRYCSAGCQRDYVQAFGEESSAGDGTTLATPATPATPATLATPATPAPSAASEGGTE